MVVSEAELTGCVEDVHKVVTVVVPSSALLEAWDNGNWARWPVAGSTQGVLPVYSHWGW